VTDASLTKGVSTPELSLTKSGNMKKLKNDYDEGLFIG
jgi:hypothetical protein